MANGISNRVKAKRNAAVEDANPFKDQTPAQIETWIDSNVGNVPQIRVALKATVRYILYLEARIKALEESHS